jgi:UDP-2,3-diacylglucosamine pyrophosphatase LpxH
MKYDPLMFATLPNLKHGNFLKMKIRSICFQTYKKFELLFIDDGSKNQNVEPIKKLAKNNSKTFLRCSEIICEKAKLYGSLHNVNGVICGHTHLPLVNTNGQIEYYNTGSWTDKNCSYITIKNGQVNLIVYD